MGVTIDPAAVFLPPRADSDYCLAPEPYDTGRRCYRARSHGGRHACIRTDGRVLAVWGEDVHEAARARRRVPEWLREMLASDPRVFFPEQERA